MIYKPGQKLAIIRIRGTTGIKQPIERTLRQLNLPKTHTCVIVEATPSIIGMIQKVQNYVTFGPVDEESIKLLDAKRSASKKVNRTGKSVAYRLAPPKQGFDRRGIKVSHRRSGALGSRGQKINTLVKKMA